MESDHNEGWPHVAKGQQGVNARKLLGLGTTPVTLTLTTSSAFK